MLFFLQNKVWLGLSLEEVKIRYRVFYYTFHAQAWVKTKPKPTQHSYMALRKFFVGFAFCFTQALNLLPSLKKSALFFHKRGLQVCSEKLLIVSSNSKQRNFFKACAFWVCKTGKSLGKYKSKA